MPDKNIEIGKKIIFNLQDLPKTAEEIVQFSENCKIWIFKGQMGVGKTTLIKEICKFFQVEDNVTSPSYSIVNEYRNAKGQIFYHFDFYRIKNQEEAMDIGYEEYFYSENICLIEWPEKISNLLPERYILISLELEADGNRIVYLSKHE
jgi:tRNA threonylcarbamoyladenosine biosynthesis protein TsaE